ncbi:MAG: hypothetical protein U9R69_07050 [Thermodesulfobacteriota bacterium]|nr:hypothetical protein [Thermodesulfobacteriota bacterium]
MRITNSYIIDQSRLASSNSSVSSADQAGKQQRIQQAKDSYNKNASSAQVIDAEYVDVYHPAPQTLQQERQELNLTLEPETGSLKQKNETDQNINSSVGKYKKAPVDVPRPGTYLNTFA